MNKKRKLCPAPRCKQTVEKWKFCCPWHWKQLTDDHRVAIITADKGENGLLKSTSKYEALKYLQGKQNEIDQKKQEKSGSAGNGSIGATV